jgi:hypothetical protein
MGIIFTEGLHDGGRRAVLLLNYILAFDLHMKQDTEEVSQVIRIVLGTNRCVDFATLLGTVSIGLLSISSDNRG